MCSLRDPCLLEQTEEMYSNLKVPSERCSFSTVHLAVLARRQNTGRYHHSLQLPF